MSAIDPGPTEERYAGFRVPPWLHHCGRFVSQHQNLWVRLGERETRLRADDIAETVVEQPVYVCGLARSGTTILLEFLAAHPDLASHRYKDYPFLFTPFLWNRFLSYVPRVGMGTRGAAGGNGSGVSPESPEAFEEVLWMAFFEQLHDPAVSNVLDEATSHPGFERFYIDHIRKFLRVRSRTRYLAKANYNVTRLEYLLKLFPDARFVLPLRQPGSQIASLVKQHRLFCEGESVHPRALEHMRRIGHFEFGLDRRPVNVGDGAMAAIQDAWLKGAEVEGWALYWASLYGYLADRLSANPRLAAAVKIVRFEELCERPFEILNDVCAHCRLADAAHLAAQAAEMMRFPSRRRPAISSAELKRVRALTGPVARRLGYTPTTGA